MVSPLTVSPDGFLAGGGAASGGVSSAGTGVDADAAVSVSGSDVTAGGLTAIAAVREGDKVIHARLSTIFLGPQKGLSGHRNEETDTRRKVQNPVFLNEEGREGRGGGRGGGGMT